jgi:hypothetical protein
MTFFGDRSLPVCAAGQTSWQRPHQRQADASSRFFCVRSASRAAPESHRVAVGVFFDVEVDRTQVPTGAPPAPSSSGRAACATSGSMAISAMNAEREQAVQPPQQLESEQACIGIAVSSRRNGRTERVAHEFAASGSLEAEAFGNEAKDDREQDQRVPCVRSPCGLAVPSGAPAERIDAPGRTARRGTSVCRRSRAPVP